MAVARGGTGVAVAGTLVGVAVGAVVAVAVGMVVAVGVFVVATDVFVLQAAITITKNSEALLAMTTRQWLLEKKQGGSSRDDL